MHQKSHWCESMGNIQLKTTEKLHVKINHGIIEICTGYQIGGSKRVIISRVKKMKRTDLPSLSIISLIYINDSLCIYHKCKRPCTSKFMYFYWVSNGSIRMRLAHKDHTLLYPITEIGKSCLLRNNSSEMMNRLLRQFSPSTIHFFT